MNKRSLFTPIVKAILNYLDLSCKQYNQYVWLMVAIYLCLITLIYFIHFFQIKALICDDKDVIYIN